MKRSAAVTIVLFSVTHPAMGQWLCQADLATGFSFDGKYWGSTDFDVSNEKFILRPLKQSEIEAKVYLDELTRTQPGKTTYGKFIFGEDSPEKYCFDHDSHINCSSPFGEFKFSKSALRFIETQSNGYWDGENSNSNTPVILIGTCTTI